MKMTVEIPDDLMVEIKIEAARQHRKLKDLVPELLRAGLRAEREEAPGPGPMTPEEVEAFLSRIQTIGSDLDPKSMDPRCMVEILLQDRR